MRKIYVSSTAFPHNDLDSIFADCRRYGIKNLEIGSGVSYDKRARAKIIKESKLLSILLHNYVPAPRVPFVLNLASNQKDILQKSRKLVETALRISGDIGAPFYGVHAGFAYHAIPRYLGAKQTHLEHFSISEAREIFVESMCLLSVEAKKNGVHLLVENNVLPSFNLINGGNKSYLMTGIDDSLNLLKMLKKYNIKMLVDVGHLNVSASTLGFDRVDFLRQLRYYIMAFHLSENNALADEHLPILPTSWFIKIINSFPNNISATLETNGGLKDALVCKDYLVN